MENIVPWTTFTYLKFALYLDCQTVQITESIRMIYNLTNILTIFRRSSMLLLFIVLTLECNATVAASCSAALPVREVNTERSWLLPSVAMDLNLPKMPMGNSQT